MYLGIDIGTSSVKVVLVEKPTEIISSEYSNIDVCRPKPGWYEQNSSIWWGA